MHGISDDFPHALFSRVQLLQVCFGENDLILNFSDGISVLVMSSVSFEGSPFEADFRKLANKLLPLLGKSVSYSSSSEDRKVLSLAFSTGETLAILDDSLEYESCVVSTVAGDRIVM
jgi:hypothetical protein